jgi:chromosome partitioning protein
MQIIGVVGRKGGSGKTTTAVHLAASLARMGHSVALVDADVQGSSCAWAVSGALPMPVYRMPLDDQDDVPEWSNAIHALKASYVVLDAPPHMNAALGGVIGLSDLVVVPCGPSGLDLVATAETISLIREVRDLNETHKPQVLLIPNRVDQRTVSGRELKDALAIMGEPVGPSIRARTAFVDSFNTGQWVGDFAPLSPAHADIMALAEHVLRTLKDKKARTSQITISPAAYRRPSQRTIALMA